MIKKMIKSTSVALGIFAVSNISLYANSDMQNESTSLIKYNKSLDATVHDLANKLLKSSRVKPNKFGDIALTSFVDLNKFNRTTHLGRSLSESFFNELFARGFDVSDFRGQKTISVNANGEYFITRDIRKLQKSTKNTYVLVGTFTTADRAIMINARIMDNRTGHIVAAARTYYKSNDCRELGTCPRKKIIRIIGDRTSVASRASKSRDEYTVANNEYGEIAFATQAKKVRYKTISKVYNEDISNREYHQKVLSNNSKGYVEKNDLSSRVSDLSLIN